MKHFEPIVIQEPSELGHRTVKVEPAWSDWDFVTIYEYSFIGKRILLDKQAATRLRDALNTILND